MQKIITPPQSIGILGGGQLGRMLAIAAKQMGYKVTILDPDRLCPARQFADCHIITDYNNEDGLNQLIQKSNVITTEFENVPANSMEYLSNSVATYPNHKIISIAANRLLEKQFFTNNHINTTKYISITLSNITKTHIPADIFPAILKTNTLGYDGKGQIKVNNLAELHSAFNSLNQVDCILEKLVILKKEFSILVARNQQNTVTYPIVENIHNHGILDISIAQITPNDISEEMIHTISKHAINIANQLEYIGILAIEFFLTQDNEILANEMAPRPHNSGHYTLDACVTSQFEQHLRAICNLQLGITTLTNNAIMLNLLGNIWLNDQNLNNHNYPAWGKILAQYNNLKLHLYDKQAAKIGRKMGHLTLVGSDTQCLKQQLDEIKSTLNIN